MDLINFFWVLKLIGVICLDELRINNMYVERLSFLGVTVKKEKKYNVILLNEINKILRKFYYGFLFM